MKHSVSCCMLQPHNGCCQRGAACAQHSCGAQHCSLHDCLITTAPKPGVVTPRASVRVKGAEAVVPTFGFSFVAACGVKGQRGQLPEAWLGLRDVLRVTLCSTPLVQDHLFFTSFSKISFKVGFLLLAFASPKSMERETPPQMQWGKTPLTPDLAVMVTLTHQGECRVRTPLLLPE